MSLEAAVQSAIYSALAASQPLLDQVSGVFDDVPQDYNQFPYVTIGEAAHAELDTDTTSGHVVTAVIHTWSRQPGRRETKLIQGAIYDALHRAVLTHDDAEFIDCHFISSESFIDADGQTRHGVQQFKILLDQPEG